MHRGLVSAVRSFRAGRSTLAINIVSPRSLHSDARRPGDVKVTFSRPFKGFKLTPPESVAYTTKEETVDFLKTLLYYRRLEIAADLQYKDKKIRGFCHLYDGQEAIVVGTEAAIKKTDSVITAYRDHCHQVGRGDTGNHVMAELMGKTTGCAKGKGGSMHMYYTKNNFFGGNGIVGAQVPVGAGLAFAHKYKKDGGVCVASYGDGAANQGQMFEAANIAALWKLPLILVCENNKYGMGTSQERASANTEFYTRYDYIPGLWLDGMDVLAVKKGFEFAAEWCRSGKGPITIEANTYRYHGHSMSDPGISYRKKEEVETIRSTMDPIGVVKQRAITNKWLTEEEYKKMEKDARARVEADVKFAQDSAIPPAQDLYSDIYTTGPPSVIRMPDPANNIIAQPTA